LLWTLPGGCWDSIIVLWEEEEEEEEEEGEEKEKVVGPGSVNHV